MKLKSRKCSFVATEVLDSSLWEQWIQEASSLWHVQCLGSAGTCNYGKERIREEHTVKGMSLCTARSFTVALYVCFLFIQMQQLSEQLYMTIKLFHLCIQTYGFLVSHVISVCILEAGTSGSPRL
jgi:hypothetical protein